MKKKAGLLIVFSLLLTAVNGQRAYPPEIECNLTVVYKNAGNTELKLWFFTPPGHDANDQAPAILFFFGGGWNGGSPEQFEKQCAYLAARGMVAAVADYRVASRHDVLAMDCVADAKSAVRWIREHAGELGVDPDRIAAGGGSAGGHLAASTGTLPTLDEPGENQDISSVPDAMVLFNPALVLAPIGNEGPEGIARLERLKPRLGVPPEQISPYHHITAEVPPTIIFHGTADTVVPYESAEEFTAKMKKQGNICKLIGYRDEGHGFFNYGRNKNGAYVSTMAELDHFLVDLGWIKKPPEIIKE